MTTLTLGAARGRMRRAVADSATMTWRNMLHVGRQPEEVVLYFSLPIVFILVFGYVLGGGMAMPGYREFLVPGVFVMTMVYGIGATATGIAVDVGRGVIDRFRAMPMSRSALLVGRSAADLLRALLEVGVLVACGLLVGWRIRNGVADAAAALGLLLLLRLALSWVGILLGLLVPNPDTVGIIVFPMAFPLTALSNILVAPETMPTWVGAVAEWNPLSATVAAIRDLFGNPGLGGDSWAAQHYPLLAVLWPVALILVCAPLAVRRYQRLGR